VPDLHARPVAGGRVPSADQSRRHAALNTAVAAVRARLDDFTDPPAARRELAALEQDPSGARARESLQELMRYVRPATEALVPLNALVAAVRDVAGHPDGR
jgi:hypothetical protein